MPATTDAVPSFEPPGPGAWARDADHQTVPRGRLVGELVDEQFTGGFQDFFGRYGMPLDRMESRHVDGWMFIRPVPAGAPDRGGPPPPGLVIAILTRVVPELRRRNKAAAAAQADKLWVRDADTWRAERSGWEARCRALLAEEPATMSDVELRAHTGRAIDLVTAMMRRHFELIGPAIGIGELLVAAEGWGVDAADIGSLLAGSSPASAATREPLVELGAEIDRAGTQPASVAELRALSRRATDLVDRFLADYGWRALEDGLDSPTVAEHPEVLLAMIDGARSATATADVDGLELAVRMRIPAIERARFDQLLADARSCYDSLDDNSGMLSWTTGLARRAALEVGARMVARGEIDEVDDLFLFSSDELVAAAGGAAGPADLAGRREAIRAAGAVTPPMTIGGEPSPPPDPRRLPAPTARMSRAMSAYLDRKFTPQKPADGGHLTIDGAKVASGVGIGDGTATGRVVVCDDARAAIDRLRPGDILVCPVTTPAWNSLFPLLAGIVTQYGGPLGHTAVTAREFGLPAVVGVQQISTDWDGADGELRTA